MKTLFVAAGLFVLTSAAMAADVGVSINVGEPGFYGRIDIGNVPQPPQVVYAQPVVVERQVHYLGEPIYLHVPPGHEKHWEKHCRQYQACGRPVYFVRDSWYQNEYVPRYREGHGEHHDHDDWHDDHHEHEEHGNGHGHGHGHGHGRGHGDD